MSKTVTAPVEMVLPSGDRINKGFMEFISGIRNQLNAIQSDEEKLQMLKAFQSELAKMDDEFRIFRIKVHLDIQKTAKHIDAIQKQKNQTDGESTK